MKAKTAIVGGGLMGTTIAWHLAQRTDGLREAVVVCEKGEIGSGASGRSSAVLSQIHADIKLAGMARDSLKFYAGFEGRSGRSIGFQPCGVVTLPGKLTPEERARFLEQEAAYEAIGIRLELLDAEGLRRRVPGIAVDSDAVAVFEPDAGFLDPERAMAAISALARDTGAVLRTGCEVDEVLIEGGRVVGLETAQGRVETNQVVVAAGPWARSFLSRHGVELPLRLLRTHQHHVARPKQCADGTAGSCPADPTDLSQTWIRGFGSQHVGREVLERDLAERFMDENEERPRHPVIVDREHGVLVRCEPARDRTRVHDIAKRHSEDVADPEVEASSTSHSFDAWARAALERRLPGYRGLATVGSDVSWENHAPDDLPIIGEVEGAEGLWVVTGFGPRGYEFAPSIGEGMAQLLSGRPVSAFDPQRFTPSRFQVRREDAPAGRRAGAR
ncbi:MAG: FAD-binding oxidoreductase [Planctomycetes bacterium]|nr:FAD-binding oxidoreductase [Planctomycetota bacterium]MCB9905063.1 FAD-binding oxidoreductase [Planctomycetota bacterium]